MHCEGCHDLQYLHSRCVWHAALEVRFVLSWHSSGGGGGLSALQFLLVKSSKTWFQIRKQLLEKGCKALCYRPRIGSIWRLYLERRETLWQYSCCLCPLAEQLHCTWTAQLTKRPQVGTDLLDSRRGESFPGSSDGSEEEFPLDLFLIQEGWTSIQALSFSARLLRLRERALEAAVPYATLQHKAVLLYAARLGTGAWDNDERWSIMMLNLQDYLV